MPRPSTWPVSMPSLSLVPTPSVPLAPAPAPRPALPQAAVPAIAAAPAPAPVAQPSNPYEALVPLTDTSPEAEAAALREALAIVLGNVTGLPDVRTSPAAAPVL